MQRLSVLLRLSRPLYLFLAGLTYFLGAGIARFLGKPPIPAAFWLGLAGVVLAVLSMSLLAEVFRPPNEPIVVGETLVERIALRDAALYIALAALAAQAVIVFLLYRDSRLSAPAFVFLGLSLLAILFYSVPPLRVIDRGFGEFCLAIQLAYIAPSISFLLQARTYHGLLIVAALPLTLLALAMLLVLDFPSYSGDLKYARRTLLARLGWERALPLHHVLVLGAYVVLAGAPLFGFSIGLLWPAFGTLVFALLQVYWLRNIGLGAKPIWNLLTANAVAIFALTAYLLTVTFWLH